MYNKRINNEQQKKYEYYVQAKSLNPPLIVILLDRWSMDFWSVQALLSFSQNLD